MSLRKNHYPWMVIGAGPAGITAVGKLLDAGIVGGDISWVDPTFTVGDLGSKWPNVSSNTRVELFSKFLHSCKAFHYHQAESNFTLSDLHPDDTCLLKHIAEPLAWVTEQLSQQVRTIKGYAQHLSMQNQQWTVAIDNNTYQARQMVLALGSEPAVLDYPAMETISLVDALDPEKIGHHISPDDRVAVFGSSHSAILVLKNLVDLGVQQIINVYRETLRFAIPMGDWIVFDNTGLKGHAAQWAKTHLNGVLPDNLSRLCNINNDRQQDLNQCNKAIYAIGFNPRTVNTADNTLLQHNPSNGIIAPGLFGLGIAFPEKVTDKLGNQEYNVGLWKFMNYIDRVLPLWLKYTP